MLYYEDYRTYGKHNLDISEKLWSNRVKGDIWKSSACMHLYNSIRYMLMSYLLKNDVDQCANTLYGMLCDITIKIGPTDVEWFTELLDKCNILDKYRCGLDATFLKDEDFCFYEEIHKAVCLLYEELWDYDDD